MLECKICGCKFNAVEERHYISRDNGKSGLAVAFGSEPEEKLYDTFDCPSCGCQIAVQDLEKIMWYTQHLIDHLRKLEKENENYEK